MSSYEVAGLCGTTWLISAIHKNIAAFQRDQFHIGTVEESAKGKTRDDTDHILLCPRHVPRLPGFAENWECAKVIEESIKEDTCCNKVHQLLKKIPVVAKYISYAAADMEVGTNAWSLFSLFIWMSSDFVLLVFVQVLEAAGVIAWDLLYLFMWIVTDFDMFRINLFYAQYSERLDYLQQESRSRFPSPLNTSYARW